MVYQFGFYLQDVARVCCLVPSVNCPGVVGLGQVKDHGITYSIISDRHPK